MSLQKGCSEKDKWKENSEQAHGPTATRVCKATDLQRFPAQVAFQEDFLAGKGKGDKICADLVELS